MKKKSSSTLPNKKKKTISLALARVVVDGLAVDVPAAWGPVAVDILVSKYFRKAGVPKTGHEVSVKQVVYRIAHTLEVEAKERRVLRLLGAPWRDDLEGEITDLLLHQKAAFNSPVWFNLGLSQEYGIKGSSGNFAWNFKTRQIEEIKDAYARPQCSACFIQSVEDDLSSIFDLVRNEARLFKYGSGTGTNFSKIRGYQELLSGGGTSSGLMSFLEVLDKGAGAIKSGGTTRRAAKMVCLEMDHPEIVDFIQWKSREEKKAIVLLQAGYSGEFEDEAYQTVSGQNSNNSVRVTDEFMQAVEEGGIWETRARTTGEPIQTLEAKDLWRMIAQAAWECADPGVQFDTTINNWNTCSATDRIYASNPCSEYMFLDDSACNLASINLVKYLKTDGSFDLEGYRRAIRALIIAQDLIVDLSSYPTGKIAKNSHDFRPLGLGYANLGALLMIKGLPYDSDEGRAWAATLTAVLTGEAYRMSAELAKKQGAFSGYTKNKRSMLRVIQKHRDAAQSLKSSAVPKSLLSAAQEVWNEALKLGNQYGFRNAQVTLLAPTGTIGLLMDCDTTGVEPEFALVKVKKLFGGGGYKIINRSFPLALRNFGYPEAQIAEIQKYLLEHLSVEGAPHLKKEHLAVFDCASQNGPQGERMISPLGHLKMMAAIQPFLSGAISKTVNLPSRATVEEIEEIYTLAWKMGLKAVAVYRSGSKHSQPLSAEAVSCGISGCD